VLKREKNMNDRRTNKTKKSIEKNFIKLLDKFDISQITVKNLCDICDINRGTFYNHYIDIYDLKNSIENKLVLKLDETISKYLPNELNKNPLPLFEEVLEFINQNIDVVTILFRENKNSPFLNKLIDVFKNRTINIFNTLGSDYNNKDYEYFLEYVIYGCLGIVNKWLNDKHRDEPKKMAFLLEKIVTNGSDFLKKKVKI
jgi:AcrR family transcriptional regulator